MIDRSRRIEIILFILILLIGSAFRLIALDSAPPGLTHDEADHGLDAAGVLAGRTPIYFTVGYGREPLYDYVSSLVMLVVGRNYLASRLTAALFGIALMVLTYVWVQIATHNRGLALGTMAAMAIGFWAVSTSRQALRSETLPVLIMAAAVCMRRGFVVDEDADLGISANGRPRAVIQAYHWFVLAGLFLGLSMYTYLAARLMWFIFPGFFVFLAITQPGVMRKAWPGLLIMLVIASMVAAPLLAYLVQNPVAEARIGQLSGPLDALRAGDLEPLRQNIRSGLAMLTFRGDDLWLYNIPGRPLLGPFFSTLFYLGLSVAVTSILFPYRPAQLSKRTYDEAFRISSANAFMLLMLVAGLLPALITGSGASNTRVIGMQPALYYMPALAAVWLADWAERQAGDRGPTAIWTSYAILIIVAAALNLNAYFGIWNNARDVRVAYHTTLVETLHYLDRHPEIGPDVAISTITPGRFHDPAVARMMLQRDDLEIRWFDGRSSLILSDNGSVTYLFPAIASLAPALQDFVDTARIDQITLRPDDFNRTVDVLEGNWSELPSALDTSVGGRFGDVLDYAGHALSASEVHPGDTLEVVTLWQIIGQTDQEIVIFTHALDSSGQVVAQQDLLGAPAWAWREGDSFLQLHTLTIPAELAPGTLNLEIGAYTQPDLVRLNLDAPLGETAANSLVIDTVEVIAP